MKRLILSTAIAALVISTMPVLAKKGGANDTEQRLTALESTVAAMEELLSRVEVPQTVYDQTGRAVGTTKDGYRVDFEIEGHDGVIYSLDIGNGDEPFFQEGRPLFDAVTTVIRFSSGGCTGDAYRAVTGSPPAMDGAKQRLSPDDFTLLEDADGQIWVFDPRVEAVDYQYFSYSFTGENCVEGSGKWSVGIKGAPLYLDWVFPLTVTEP
jgi:hypothetical protein